jgi:hypothetical protein
MGGGRGLAVRRLVALRPDDDDVLAELGGHGDTLLSSDSAASGPPA